MTQQIQETMQHSQYSDYRKHLESAAADWFKSNGKIVAKSAPYVLSKRSLWPDNIILQSVVGYIKKKKSEAEEKKMSFPLHKWVHHGLSSQAMLFNLFGPLLATGDISPAKSAFNQWPSGEVSAAFEVEDREVFKEKQAQPTSIDLVISGTSNKDALFIEAKLVEQEFGGCSVFSRGDCCGKNPANNFSECYLHKIERTYWDRLNEYGFIKGLVGIGPICPLANYYQFFREVIFALVKGGSFVLLYDERSPVFHCSSQNGDTGLMPFLTEFVPQNLQPHVSSVSIQTVVQSIKDSNKHNDWISEFEKKYGLV